MANLFSSLELLESRIAPAGVITIAVTKDGIVVTGDNLGNELSVTQNDFEITFTPKNETEIKLTTSSTSSKNPITLSLLDSDMKGSSGRNVSIDLGDGGDVLTLESLTLPGDLSLDMGNSGSSPETEDSLTIGNLRVGADLDVASLGGTVSVFGSLYVGLNLDIYSDAKTFTVEVDSFYVGNDMEVDAILRNETDKFTINADTFAVYDDLDFYAHIEALAAPVSAITLNSLGVFSVGGDFLIQNDGSGGKAVVSVNAQFIDVAGTFWLENRSVEPTETLDVFVDADHVLRLNGGVDLFSTSPAPSTVEISANLAIIDGLVSAKLTRSSGDLSIIADHLTIYGNVKFASKGEGNLLIQGAGDIYGKVSASIGGGAGSVGLQGQSGGELTVTSVKIATPKAPSDAAGVQVGIDNVLVLGKTKIALARGSNVVDIDDTIALGRVSIVTGGGNDEVNIHTVGTATSAFHGGLKVSLGAGTDLFTLGREEVSNAATALFLYGKKSFNGGSGADLYTVEDRNVQFLKSASNRVALNPVVRGFEPPTTIQ